MLIAGLIISILFRNGGHRSRQSLLEINPSLLPGPPHRSIFNGIIVPLALPFLKMYSKFVYFI